MRISYLLAGLSLLIATPASASVFSDDFARCLVNKTTAADKIVLVQWIFTTISVNPAVKSMSNITDGQRLDYTRRIGALMDRLVTQDCRAESIAALKYDGASAVEASFEVLGKVAMQEFMGNPAVAAELGHLDQAIDRKKWEALMREAGIKVAPESVAN